MSNNKKNCGSCEIKIKIIDTYKYTDSLKISKTHEQQNLLFIPLYIFCKM